MKKTKINVSNIIGYISYWRYYGFKIIRKL